MVFVVIIMITPPSVVAEDSDGDGYDDSEDDCKETAGSSTDGTVGCPDEDGDGWSDEWDTFPMDETEWEDCDDDGIGNNADDDDAVCDNADDDYDGDGYLDDDDNCPLISNSDQVDTDDDGQGDACDTDDDGDGVSDQNDAFPFDSGRAADDLGSQVIYVFTGDATALQYLGLFLAAMGLVQPIIRGRRKTAKGKSSDKQMQSLSSMIERAQSTTELATIKNTVDEKFVRKEITFEHHMFLNGKITEKNSVVQGTPSDYS